MSELPDLDFLRGQRPPSFDASLDTVDVYYWGGPFSGWVGRFPCIDGEPVQDEIEVIAEDSEHRIEGVYVFDGFDIEGRPLLRWEQRGAGVDADPDAD